MKYPVFASRYVGCILSGTNEVSLLRHDITFILVSICPSINDVAYLSLIILPVGCFSSLLYPNHYLGLWWAQLRMSVGTLRVDVQTSRTVIRVSAFIDRRFARPLHPAAAVDVGTPTYLRATVADFHRTYAIRPSVAIPSMLWFATSPTASCAAYPPYLTPANGSGRWWSS